MTTKYDGLYEHVVRKTTYAIIGEAEMQANMGPASGAEGQRFIVYRAMDDGSLWVRPYDEFFERFKRVT